MLSLRLTKNRQPPNRQRPTVTAPNIARPSFIGGIGDAFATTMLPEGRRVEIAFDQWIAAFRNKALARGVTDDTYTHVMAGLRPDTTGLEAIHNQPEFTQKLWQYLNRGADGRIGGATPAAVQNFQRKAGILPADSYPGIGLLAQLRKGP
jgi:membrane-bound lytic murein transglycosylase B